MIFGTILGLPRSGKFGFHFHEYPIENESCESGGEHFNVRYFLKRKKAFI